MKQLLLLLEKLKFMPKLLLAAVFGLSFILLLGIVSLKSVVAINSYNQNLYDRELVGTAAIAKAHVNYRLTARYLREAVLASNAAEREQAITKLNRTVSDLHIDLARASIWTLMF